MAVVRQDRGEPVDAQELGAAFADMLRGDHVAKRLWVSEHSGLVRLWLLTKPMDGSGERRLHGLEGDLYDRFPGASFHLVLLNPRYFEDLHLEDVLPGGAEEIALSAA